MMTRSEGRKAWRQAMGWRTTRKQPSPKGRRSPLPLPGDGTMVDVDGAFTLPGVRKIGCEEAARWRKGGPDGPGFGAA